MWHTLFLSLCDSRQSQSRECAAGHSIQVIRATSGCQILGAVFVSNVPNVKEQRERGCQTDLRARIAGRTIMNWYNEFFSSSLIYPSTEKIRREGAMR